MNGDLTVVYYTANRISPHFETNVRRILSESIGGLPLVSVSQKPMDFGYNICVGDIGQSHLNIYRQMLIGAKEAETRYIAFAEDDILYPPEHFLYRPTDDSLVDYDMHKWAFYTWTRPPVFHSSSRRRTTGCIVARDLFIEAMEERFARYPDEKEIPFKWWAELGRYEGALGVTVRQTEEFYPSVPHVVFFHEAALGFRHLGKRKKGGDVRVAKITRWGAAEDMLRLYYEDDEWTCPF